VITCGVNIELFGPGGQGLDTPGARHIAGRLRAHSRWFSLPLPRSGVAAMARDPEKCRAFGETGARATADYSWLPRTPGLESVLL
jgi:hypothetical protein